MVLGDIDCKVDFRALYVVEGNYTQSSPPPSNDWHYVNIRGQNGSANVFTWENKAGVEWDLIFVEKYSQYHCRFEVLCNTIILSHLKIGRSEKMACLKVG